MNTIFDFRKSFRVVILEGEEEVGRWELFERNNWLRHINKSKMNIGSEVELFR